MLVKRCKTFSTIVGCVVCTSVFAGNGIDSSTIPYKQWPNGRPASVSVISGKVIKNLRLFGGTLPQGVAWENSNGETQEEFRQKICNLANEPCKPFRQYGVSVIEHFLGKPANTYLPKLGTPQQMGRDSLNEIGHGAKRILLLSVQEMGLVMQTATVVFDETVTDDELRQLALEDAVYRVLRYRED